ncbi:MAG: hypothetical protein ACLRR3_11980 [Eubacterium sp.]
MAYNRLTIDIWAMNEYRQPITTTADGGACAVQADISRRSCCTSQKLWLQVSS